MTDAHQPQTQTQFVESSVRDGHSLAAVQMWQNLCRRLAVLGDDTESITNVVLSMSDQHGVSPLSICDRLLGNGVKKLDGAALEMLIQLADDEYNPPSDRDDDDDDDDKPVPATQPMTPPQDEAEAVCGPAPKRTAKRKLFVDLTAEDELVNEDEF